MMKQRALFSIIPLLLMMMFYVTSCGIDSSNTGDFLEYDLEAVAASDEYESYRNSIDELGQFFIRNGIDMERVRDISTSIGPDNPNYQSEFEAAVVQLEGGPEYLDINRRMEASRIGFMKRFNMSELSKENISELSRIYRTSHQTTLKLVE